MAGKGGRQAGSYLLMYTSHLRHTAMPACPVTTIPPSPQPSEPHPLADIVTGCMYIWCSSRVGVTLVMGHHLPDGAAIALHCELRQTFGPKPHFPMFQPLPASPAWVHTCKCARVRSCVHACGRVCVCACVRARMCACLSAYVPTYVRACVAAYMCACVPAYVHVCMHTWPHACLHACVHAYLHACVRACLPACMRACVPAYLRACVSASCLHRA